MVDQPDSRRWQRTTRTRVLVVGAMFALWAVAVFARLVDLQVCQHKELEARAERQQTRLVSVPARRGEILDRRGRVLAYSVDADSIYAVPGQVPDHEQSAARLCQALGDCEAGEADALVARLDRKGAFVWVRRRVSADQAKRVAALGIAGIGSMLEPRRFYPNRELASQVLGFVGLDDRGLAGLEATYDSTVRGRPGMLLVQHDSRQQVFNRVGDPPVPGATVELTIDEYLQHIAERELRAGVEEFHAAGGAAVVMDPNTGEILALASEPTFNPNVFQEVRAEERRNRAVQDVYEPGSTFKIVTATAALEEHALSPTDIIDTGRGSIAIGPRVVRDTHAYGALSFTDVIVKSSNVGAIKIGMRLGATRLGRYVREFGFGTRLSPDFPGENAGIVWDPARWTESALASVSMGYQISVTPLQMVTAAGAVANGGELIQPRVLRAVTRGNVRTEVPRRVLRRVMTPDTAAALTTIMEGVVERGTGKEARLPDFTVAGKTGTAHKLVDGHYSPTDYNASFVGFVPSRKPALAILVVVDSPRGHGYFGGVVSAPIFRRIADASLRYLGVAPTIDPVPPVLVARADTVKARTVAGPAVPLTIVPASSAALAGQVVLPELKGLSAREALKALARLGVSARVTGDGVVTEQDPPPGTALEPGASCRLALGRPALPGAQS